MKRLLIIFVFLFGVFLETQAQAPGLLGKRHVFFADYGFVGTLYSDIYYHKPDAPDFINGLRFVVRSKFQFSYDYQLKRNLSAGITYSFNRGGVNYDWRDEVAGERIRHNNAPYIGHTFLPNIKVYRTRREAGGAIAPLGFYTVYRLGVAMQNLPGVPEKGAGKSSLLSAGAGLGMGKNVIVGKKLLLNLGAEVAYFHALGDNPYMGSDIDIRNNGLIYDYIFNIRLGLGFAAF